MYDAWCAGSRTIVFENEEIARENALKIGAKVLSNRRPPYSIPGGLFDALRDTGGEIEVADNSEMEAACRLFEEYEGIDIHPAAGIALAGMIKSIKKRCIDPNSVLMLNITGGGEKRVKEEYNMIYHEPDLIIDNSTEQEVIINMAEALFK